MKITRMDWTTVCSSKEVGGLEVRRIREFNIALLGKWCWRVMADTHSLWYRVLPARYGVEGGRLMGGGRDASLWWRDICALGREEWFSDHVSRAVGNGRNTRFWVDGWLGGVAFSVRFSRLYDLSLDREVSVSDMFQGEWGIDGEAWRWRRRLFVWEEEMLGDLTLLLQNVILQVHKDDKWMWILESSNVFSVKSAYNALTSQPPIELPVTASSLWHKDVPLKVVLFAWRLFRDRLPTKDNLHRRGVLDQASMLCVLGCGLTETSNHLFLHCNIFGSIWHFINR